MSARWGTAPPTGPPSNPGSSNRLNIPPSGSSASSAEVQAIVKLVRSDPDFRSELKNVIAEALQPDLEKLKAELTSQLNATVSSSSTQTPPPLDYDSIIQRDFPGAVLEEWTHMDDQGAVYGFPETVSTHIIRHNQLCYLCDIKDGIDISDVVFLIRIGKLFRSTNPNSTLACVIICRHISPRGKTLADKCKIKTIIAP